MADLRSGEAPDLRNAGGSPEIGFTASEIENDLFESGIRGQALILPRRSPGRQTEVAAQKYQDDLRTFAKLVLEINSRLDFRVSSRGWAYILEEHGLLKGDFATAQGLINDCRKIGLLPIDICAEDDGRSVENFLEHDGDIDSEVDRALWNLRCWHVDYRPILLWDTIDFYVEMAVEKVDLKSLFAPICREYQVPIFNASGWADINSRAAMMQRFARWEAKGKTCVLLYAGDHDPGGLSIAASLRSNLAALADAVGWSPENLIIERFGLNYDFIVAEGLTWIENLETGSGTRLDDPRHRDHRKPYVQDYLAKYGARKVEANALVTRPEAGRRLCRETIRRYVSEADLKSYQDQLTTAQDNLAQEIARRSGERQ